MVVTHTQFYLSLWTCHKTLTYWRNSNTLVIIDQSDKSIISYLDIQNFLPLCVYLECMLSYLSSSPHIWATHSRLGVHSRLHINPLLSVFICPGIENQIEGTSEHSPAIGPGEITADYPHLHGTYSAALRHTNICAASGCTSLCYHTYTQTFRTSGGCSTICAMPPLDSYPNYIHGQVSIMIVFQSD